MVLLLSIKERQSCQVRLHAWHSEIIHPLAHCVQLFSPYTCLVFSCLAHCTLYSNRVMESLHPCYSSIKVKRGLTVKKTRAKANIATLIFQHLQIHSSSPLIPMIMSIMDKLCAFCITRTKLISSKFNSLICSISFLSRSHAPGLSHILHSSTSHASALSIYYTATHLMPLVSAT